MNVIHLGRVQLRFDWQILPLMLSTIVGLTLAYNRDAAALQFVLFSMAVLVYLLLLNKSEPPLPRRSSLRSAFTLLPLVIGVYFLFTNDWARWAEKLAFLKPVTGLLASLQIGPAWLRINPNVIGGVMAMLLPLQVAALRYSRRTAQVILIGFSVVVLILTQTRGAWLALGFAACMATIWQIAKRFTRSQRAARGVWGTAVLLGGIALIALLTWTPLGTILIDSGGQRLDIWRNSLALINDYPITGHGLAGFEMVYSTYALLVHVGNTMHAHNLWFDIWLNVGLFGVIALAGMTLNAIWPRSTVSPWRMAALIALATLLLHGLYDDAWLGYGGVGLPLLLVPLALATRAGPKLAEASLVKPRRFQPARVLWGATLVGLLIGLIVPQGQSLLASNLGALAQTQAELSVYRWPEVPIQDALRQSGQVNLDDASSRYEAALQLDPNNAVANRRLGQIELAQGRYDVACQRLEQAGKAAPEQRATRQLLGECYAMQGKIAEAADLWETIDNQERQLETRIWWYDGYLDDSQRAATLSQVLQIVRHHP
jgi:O-antigen ligase